MTVVLLAFSLVLPAGVVHAATPSAGLTLDSFAAPSNFSTADNTRCESTIGEHTPACDAYEIGAMNAGSVQTNGGATVLTANVPSSLTVKRVSFFWSGAERLGISGVGEGTDLAEAFPSAFCSTTPLQCKMPLPLAPDDRLKMVVYVTVNEGTAASELALGVAGSIGGGPPVTNSASVAIGSTRATFGVARFSSGAVGVDGAPSTQAGEHPYELTTRLDLTSRLDITPQGNIAATSVQDVKDVVVDLPLGFVGSARATPKCTLAELSSGQHCPADTQVGHILTEPEGSASVNGPIYNLVPEHGVAAEFGYVDVLRGPHALYAQVVPSPSGYVLQVTSRDVPQVWLNDIVVSFYGDPASRDATGNTPIAQFTNPSECSGAPLVTTVHLDSWQSPGRFNGDGTPDLSDPSWTSAGTTSPPMTGCDRLQFGASLSAQPDTLIADSPSGLEFDLKVPQSDSPQTLASPPLKDATVALPPGLTVDPSAADGLAACSPQQIDLASAGAPSCPKASKIGTVELTTPLLGAPLSGSIYLAAQNDNPFNSLLAGYVVVEDPTTGVVVKVPGRLDLDPSNGQITGVFENNPQLPFSELKLNFFGGSHGDLATPEACGSFTTSSALTPWSAPGSGPPVEPADAFSISSGCVGGFAPSFSAGTIGTLAGAYSPFVLSFSRSDTDEELGGLSVSLPPGLLAKVADVPLCSDSDAGAGTCPAASRIGSVIAGSGPGPDPAFLPGNAYLTGPYNGGPYGVAVVVPAVVGPFNLGNVVVRTSLRIDPHDAHVTAVSDRFPTIVQGVPIRLRRVDVSLDRPAFTFNPTNCTPFAINGTLSSVGGARAAVSSRTQVGGCRELAFKPRLTARTQGNASKANGASLVVRVESSPGQANIAKTRLVLPPALPSRLTTIQKACPDAVFEANPASCGVGSNIGTASVHTPILKSPLTGPAYLVSHGSAAFPDVEFVLQGEGITLILDGQTDIKKGITTSTFSAIPDAPLSAFEAVLPEGPHSALTSNVPQSRKFSLCGSKLVMPTTITGQNGSVVEQRTPILVTGCRAAGITPAQRLTRTLKECRAHRRHNRRRRRACERHARTKYGAQLHAKRPARGK